VQVVDPRLRVRYTSGHIQGALHLPLARAFDQTGRLLPHDQLVAWLAGSGVSSDRPVLVYDQADGEGQAGAMLAWILEYLGHPGVRLLRPAFEGWAADGGEVFYRPVPAEPTDFDLRPRPELRASWDDLVEPEGINLVDARSFEEFSGEMTVGDDPPGHIPGATNLPWLDFVDGRRDLFVPLGQARQVVEQAKLAHRRSIVYCRAGPRAAVVVMSMRAAGLDARLYDGSWIDWTKRQLPIETTPGRVQDPP
jgi:thiosulfate/3-mercaptopyruvate sulfurtransferase